jgi:hypothetical protein
LIIIPNMNPPMKSSTPAEEESTDAMSQDQIGQKTASQNPLLERLSWVASILSFILGILVWLMPSPISFASGSSANVTILETTIRLLFFSILLGFGIALLIFNIVKPKGHIQFRIHIIGDWGAHTSIVSGIMQMLLSSCFVLWWIYQREVWTIISGMLIFSFGAFQAIWGMKRNVGLLRGEGEATAEAGTEWLFTIGLISVVSLLITGVVVILLLRLAAMP